jgi:hypothetical protein
VLSLAATFTTVGVATGIVATSNETVSAPLGRTTELGLLTAGESADSVTMIPPVPTASLLIVTVPTTGLPPTTDVWLNASPAMTVGNTVTTARAVVPTTDAVIVADVGDSTPAAARTVNEMPVVPSPMRMEGDTVRAGLLLVRVTGTPPAGAGELITTCPIADPPAAIEAGTANVLKTTASGLSVASRRTAFSCPGMPKFELNRTCLAEGEIAARGVDQ